MSAHRARLGLVAALALLAAVAGVHRAVPDLRWADLWRTRDQQGRDAFERGDFVLAADRFADPRWRGAACYRAGDNACAVTVWVRFDDAEDEYNLGNATLREGLLDTALAHYDRALSLNPGWPQAMHNRALTLQLIDAARARQREKARRRPGEKGDDEGEPDTRIDDKSREGKPGQVRIQKLAPGDVDAIWLRNMQTDPAAFLRRRFAAELAGTQKDAPRAPQVAPQSAASPSTGGASR
jgi:Ca-activated chloride channel family protein